MKPISYARHRFPPDVIRHAIWLYLRFTLSYRDVEDLLAERGLIVSNEVIRRGVLKFGPVIARNLRKSRPQSYTRAVRSRLVPDPHGAHPSLEGVAKSSVIVTDEIFGDVRISASSEARDRKSPVTTQQISLSMSPMKQSIA